MQYYIISVLETRGLGLLWGYIKLVLRTNPSIEQDVKPELKTFQLLFTFVNTVPGWQTCKMGILTFVVLGLSPTHNSMWEMLMVCHDLSLIELAKVDIYLYI